MIPMFNCPKSSVEALPPLLLVQDAQLVFVSSFGIISFPVSINDIEVTIEKILNKKTA